MQDVILIFGTERNGLRDFLFTNLAGYQRHPCQFRFLDHLGTSLGDTSQGRPPASCRPAEPRQNRSPKRGMLCPVPGDDPHFAGALLTCINDCRNCSLGAPHSPGEQLWHCAHRACASVPHLAVCARARASEPGTLRVRENSVGQRRTMATKNRVAGLPPLGRDRVGRSRPDRCRSQRPQADIRARCEYGTDRVNNAVSKTQPAA